MKRHQFIYSMIYFYVLIDTNTFQAVHSKLMAANFNFSEFITAQLENNTYF